MPTTIKGGDVCETGSSKYTFTFDDNVWWDCYHTIAEVTLPLLQQYKAANRNGAPRRFFPNDFKHDDSNPHAWVVASLAWEAAIDKMIAAFTILANDNGVMSVEEDRIVEDGLLEFAANFQSLWD